MLNYFSRYKTLPAFFKEKPNKNVGLIVVIPCYDDDFVFQTLENLNVTYKPRCAVEVIVVVNSSENANINIINNNHKILKILINISKNNNYYFKLLPILIENVPKKFAGVGNARKTGMDEAVRRFTQIENFNGIIASLDSDCLVSKNYFIEIEKYFANNLKSDCCTINFQHNFDKNLYSKKEISACKLYETYLRYFRLCLAATGFPYCFHTIGSCFAVKTLCYCKAGGMARLQAGEDFYFLHKVAQSTKVGRIDEKLVFPAPRLSDRVPFGTGKTIQKIIENQQYMIYNFELFLILKKFFATFENIFQTKNIDLKIIPAEIINFTTEKKIFEIFNETFSNTKHKEQFLKRLYSKFDAFFVIKFLNSFNNSEVFPLIELFEAIKKLFDYYKIYTDNFSAENIYKIIYDLDIR
ncbi:MAG: glycosyltransferase family 2 protein [Paludibacter sp.]|nr:glycosyltransferase family 2 protein [Paludibacter sp.]